MNTQRIQKIDNLFFSVFWYSFCYLLAVHLVQPMHALARVHALAQTDTQAVTPVEADTTLADGATDSPAITDGPAIDMNRTETIVQDTVTTDSLAAPPELLARPRPLKPLPLDRVDPSQTIDHLLKKQVIKMHPYTPLLQEIVLGVEVLSLLKDSWNAAKNIKKYDVKRSYVYDGYVSLLFRRNVRLVMQVGYATRYPPRLQSNESSYRTAGFYGSGGLDYLFRYSALDHFYTGLRYSGAMFMNYTLPYETFRKRLMATWVEALAGAESSLLDQLNIYGGCALRLGWLINFSKFPPAQNYQIPGYGMSVNKVNLTLDLYILYKISFIERIINVT